MVKKLLMLAAIAVAYSNVALAEDAAKEPVKSETEKKADAEKKAEPKLTEVRFCPMMGHNVKGKGAGQRVYKDYRLFFC